MLLEVRQETKGAFPVSTEILGFLSIFKKSQASSAFEALNSTSLWKCEGMSESPVETLEKGVGLRLIWTGGITSL